MSHCRTNLFKTTKMRSSGFGFIAATDSPPRKLFSPAVAAASESETRNHRRQDDNPSPQAGL
jgi:hypothetical protein